MIIVAIYITVVVLMFNYLTSTAMEIDERELLKK